MVSELCASTVCDLGGRPVTDAKKKPQMISTKKSQEPVENVRAYNEAKYKAKRTKERLDKAETDHVNAIGDGTVNDDIRKETHDGQREHIAALEALH